MYALIIDGFDNTQLGRRNFDQFQQFVHASLDQTGEKNAVQVRKLNGIESYLFLPDEGYRNNNNAFNFDKVDMIFIDGEPNLLPWHPDLEQVRVLLKMSLLTNKSVFACTFAMQMITFMCATT